VLLTVNQVGCPIAAQYLLATLGMALGGVIFDQTGTYATAFLAGFAFNVMNLVLIAALHLR
jgi:cyanate permease